jgi:crotonobetainyl-CoA:carnitine CoA-transferase CaiB-like acyl-CoA transferase
MSGPMASHLLTELGAEVIKVENSRVGDGNRGATPLIAGSGFLHVALNPGTRSLTIDRRSPHWDTVLAACSRWADAVIVGTRPKDARARGMDFASLQRANPSLIYCMISGFGDTGPWQDYLAHGQTIDALAGRVAVEWVDGLPQTVEGWRSAGTTLAGVFAALGVLAAVHRRDQGHTEAQYVSVSLWQAAMWWNWRDLNQLRNEQETWNEYRDLGTRYSMYPTADGRAILVAPSERKFWERFIDLTGLPQDWKGHGSWSASGMDHGAGPAYAHERQVIAERMRTRRLEDWVKTLEAAEIPFAPVLSLEEALNSEHARANGVMRPTTIGDRRVEIAAAPVRIGATDSPAGGAPPALPAPPALGEQTNEILAAIGLSDLAGQI